MNSDDLALYVGRLLADEEEYGVQNSLEEIVNALKGINANPQSAASQRSLVEYQASLKNEVAKISTSYSHAQWISLHQLNAAPFSPIDYMMKCDEFFKITPCRLLYQPNSFSRYSTKGLPI